MTLPTANSGHWLRYTADRRTLFFVAGHFALIVASWLWNPTGPMAALAVILLGSSSYQCAVITHNVIHGPVFHSRRMNRLFQVVLTHTYGHPVSTFVPGHNLSHHKYVETDRDVMRTTKVRSRFNLINILMFYPTVAPAILKNDARFARGMKARNPRWHRQLMTESVVLAVVSVTLLVLDPIRAALFWFLPHFVGGWGIISTNMLQHDGCDANHPYNHSRNFTGRVFNWLLVNNGFHSIHHDQPTLHWSFIPEAHERLIKPHMHPNLDEPSMFLYLVKTFVPWRRRVMYDGSPYDSPGPTEDVSWIPEAGQPMPDISLGAEAA